MTVEADGTIEVLRQVAQRRRNERLATAALAAALSGDDSEQSLTRLDSVIPALRDTAAELHVPRRPRSRQPLKALVADLTLALAEQVRSDLVQIEAATPTKQEQPR